MRFNLRLHPTRDADLIRHLERMRAGARSDEVRHLMRAGLASATMPPSAMPHTAAGALPSQDSVHREDSTPQAVDIDLRQQVLDGGW